MHARLMLGAAAVTVAACAPGDMTPPDLEIERAEVEQLACFDADYPIDPTFATPEEALEHAVETEGDEVPVPANRQEYERVERGEGWVEFSHEGEGEVHHTWGITRDDDGRWGMTSLGGCVPAER